MTAEEKKLDLWVIFWTKVWSPHFCPDFPANDIVKFLLGFTNKGPENFIVESLDASFRYPQVQKTNTPFPPSAGEEPLTSQGPALHVKAFLTWFLFGPPQDYQFYIQNFTALQLGTVVPSGRQATFEYSFIPAEPMGGRPFGLVINLNYKDGSVRSRGVVAWGCISTCSHNIHNTLLPCWVGLRCCRAKRMNEQSACECRPRCVTWGVQWIVSRFLSHGSECYLIF